MSNIGPNSTRVEEFTSVDDTLNSIFIPSLAQRVRRDGRLKSWTLAFARPGTEIYLQVRSDLTFIRTFVCYLNAATSTISCAGLA